MFGLIRRKRRGADDPLTLREIARARGYSRRPTWFLGSASSFVILPGEDDPGERELREHELAIVRKLTF